MIPSPNPFASSLWNFLNFEKLRGYVLALGSTHAHLYLRPVSGCCFFEFDRSGGVHGHDINQHEEFTFSMFAFGVGVILLW
jgi:hypothetical protein